MKSDRRSFIGFFLSVPFIIQNLEKPKVWYATEELKLYPESNLKKIFISKEAIDDIKNWGIYENQRNK